MLTSSQLLWIMICVAGAAKSEIFNAEDAKACTDLCSGCGGTSTFDNGVCDCLGQENDEKSGECIKRLIKQREEAFNHESIDSAADVANRDARCCMSKSRKRMRSGDLDRVLNYFANDGPRTGMPLLGNPNVNCRPEDPTNAQEIQTSDAETAEAIVAQAPIERNDHQEAELMENYAPVVLNVELPNRRPSSLGTPRALESRSILSPHNSLLGIVANGFLKIPHLLTDIVYPGYRGMHYSPFLGVPHFFNILGGLHRSRIYNCIAAGVHGVPRSVNDHVASYVPENHYEHVFGVPEDELMNPYVGIPNALLAGVQTPSYYPGLMTSSHVPRSLQPAAVQDGVADDTKMMENQLDESQTSQSQQPSGEDQGNSNLLYETITQQNAILEPLNQQLRNYSPYAEMPYYHYQPTPHNFVGSYAPSDQCRCNNVEESSAPRAQSNDQSSNRVNNPLENHSSKTGLD